MPPGLNMNQSLKPTPAIWASTVYYIFSEESEVREGSRKTFENSECTQWRGVRLYVSACWIWLPRLQAEGPALFFHLFLPVFFAATASPCAALRGDGWPDGDVHGGPEHAAAVLRLFSCHQAPPASQLHGRPARARPGRCDASLEPQRHQNLVA